MRKPTINILDWLRNEAIYCLIKSTELANRIFSNITH